MTSSDLAIYIRLVLHKYTTEKPVQYFLQRAELINIADRTVWLRDFRLLCNLRDGDISPEITQSYEGLNLFIARQPLKETEIEDFFIDFEYLITKGRIKTPINREAGRPFAFEVAKHFSDSVSGAIREFAAERLLDDEEQLEANKGMQKGNPSLSV